MARPITWRNIAGPNFNNSAGGQAIDAFNLAGRGFLQGSEQLMDTQDRIDAGYTNEAMLQALKTGQVDPNLNPRANAAAVYEAVLGKRKADTEEDTSRSALRTAVVNRNNLRADTDYTKENTRRLELENDPAWQKLLKDEKLAQIDRWQAMSSNEKAELGINEEKLKMLRNEVAKEEAISTSQQTAESLFGELFNQHTDKARQNNLEIQQSTFGPQIAAMVKRLQEKGATPEEIQLQVQLARQDAEERMRFMDQDALTSGYSQAVEDLSLNPTLAGQLGLTNAQFGETTGGAAVQNLQEQARNRADAISSAKAEIDAFQLDTARNAANDTKTFGVILDKNGNPRLARDAGELDGNGLTKGQWKAEIDKAGLTDELKGVYETAFNLAQGNKSILDNVLSQGKKLTAQGFLEQVSRDADNVKRFATDERLSILNSQIGATDLGLPGSRRRIADNALDESFLASEGPPREDIIKSTDDRELRQDIVPALKEIQELRKARPDMDVRQANILDRFESIFMNGSVQSTNPAFTNRRTTNVFNDSDIRKELEEWNAYQKRNGYK